MNLNSEICYRLVRHLAPHCKQFQGQMCSQATHNRLVVLQPGWGKARMTPGRCLCKFLAKANLQVLESLVRSLKLLIWTAAMPAVPKTLHPYLPQFVPLEL